MPLPLLPLLGLGAGLLDTGVNAITQGAVNRQNREFALDMYNRQRDDALADWNRQNMYNSPAMQMDRLRAAGLNPNLVYGNGATAMSNNAVRSSSGSPSSAQAPRVDTSGAVMGMYDLQMKSAQMEMLSESVKLNKLKQMTELYAMENKAADTDQKRQNIRRSQYDLGFQIENREALSETIRQHLEKLKADTTYTLDQNERAAALNAVSVRKAAEEILSIRLGRAKTSEEINQIKQQIENLKSSKALQDLEAEWMRNGKTKGDWYFWRFLNDAVGGNPGKVINKGVRKNLLQGWGEPE